MGNIEEAKRRIEEEKIKKTGNLELDGLGLKEIPEEVFELIWLKELRLEENNISFISSKIRILENLEQLHIGYNKLDSLPEEFEYLKSLAFLIIRSNQFIKFPEIIYKLDNLIYLSIESNYIKKVSFGIESLKKLKYLKILPNPFEDFPELEKFDFDYEIGELSLFNLIKKLKFPDSDKKYFTLRVNKELKTAIQQYLLFFKDYVAGAKKKKIRFEVREETEDSLLLITNGDNEITIEEMQAYFEEYVGFTRQNVDKWVMKVDERVSPMEADLLRLKMQAQYYSFNQQYEIATIENRNLKDENTFLRQLASDFAKKPTIIIQNDIEEIDLIALLRDLIDKATRMLERKATKKIEDLHNDDFTDFLRDKGYNATDQTRSGKAKITAGEVDIMIRKKNGTPVSVIEAFRLDSCGEKNAVISAHLDKLLHDYDTAGHEINFVIVYAEAQNFEDLWQNYQTYLLQLGKKPEFRNEYPLLNFQEMSGVSKKQGIKVGLVSHQRGNSIVQVYHIFIDMYVA